MTTAGPKVEQLSGAAVELDEELEVDQAVFQIVDRVSALVPVGYSGIQPSPLPTTVQLGFLRDARLRMVEPFEVIIAEEDGQIVAEADELNEFGYGRNPSDAITDLQHTVAELYFTLKEDEARLGKELLNVWQTLQHKIREI